MAATPGAPYRIEPFAKSHDRAGFSCGSEPLDRYFKTQASQDIRRRVAKCMVAVEIASGAVAGYYTLSAMSLALAALPDPLAKGLPHYPVVPSVLLGRLAIASNAQGRKLGRALLAHALEYVATSQIGAFAVIVDAKDDAARRFYEHHGFVGLIGQERRLILPNATALAAFGTSRG